MLNHKATYLFTQVVLFYLVFQPSGAPVCSGALKYLDDWYSVNMKSTVCKCGCVRRDEQVATPEILQQKQVMAEFTPPV